MAGVRLVESPKPKAVEPAEPAAPTKRLNPETNRVEDIEPEGPASVTTRSLSDKAASPEAISRVTEEKKAGITVERVDVRTGKSSVVPNTVDRVDVRPGKFEVIVKRNALGKVIDRDAHPDLRPADVKRATPDRAPAKPEPPARESIQPTEPPALPDWLTASEAQFMRWGVDLEPLPGGPRITPELIRRWLEGPNALRAEGPVTAAEIKEQMPQLQWQMNHIYQLKERARFRGRPDAEVRSVDQAWRQLVDEDFPEPLTRYESKAEPAPEPKPEPAAAPIEEAVPDLQGTVDVARFSVGDTVTASSGRKGTIVDFSADLTLAKVRFADGITEWLDGNEIDYGHVGKSGKWESGKAEPAPEAKGEPAAEAPAPEPVEAPAPQPKHRLDPETNTVVPIPQPGGHTIKVFGTNIKKPYQAQYQLGRLKELIRNHPKVQPRDRTRVASAEQIQHIAANLDVDRYMLGANELDRGPAITKKFPEGTLTLSGNGRLEAVEIAKRQYPELYAEFQKGMREYVEQSGLDVAEFDRALKAGEDPIIHRDLLTPVEDYHAFADEANQSAAMVRSAQEKALTDAKRLPSEILTEFVLGDSQTIEQAIISPSNAAARRAFVQSVPKNEHNEILNARGDNLNPNGVQRMKAAMVAKQFPGESGSSLVRAITEGSQHEGIKNLQTALLSVVPKLGKLRQLVKLGQRAAHFDISTEITSAMNVLARLRDQGMNFESYSSQMQLGETAATVRELNPVGEALLQVFYESKSAKQLKTFLNAYVDAALAEPIPGQGALIKLDPVGPLDIIRAARSELNKTAGRINPGLLGGTALAGAAVALAPDWFRRFMENRGRQTLTRQNNVATFVKQAGNLTTLDLLHVFEKASPERRNALAPLIRQRMSTEPRRDLHMRLLDGLKPKAQQ